MLAVHLHVRKSAPRRGRTVLLAWPDVTHMSSNQPTLVVRCAGRKPVRMNPGQRIRIGRHASNDLVLSDDTVSRFHAVVEWDADEDRPYVVDNESANGVDVDGEPIEVKCYLPGGNQIGIGRFTLVVEVTGVDEDDARPVVPELSDSDSVVLYTEKREQISGRTSFPEELHRVLLDMESAQRTGTLQLRLGAGLQGRVTFCQGLIMTAQCGAATARDALREILIASSAIYSFTRELRPAEDPLNLSVRTYLESELTDLTKKIVMRRSPSSPGQQS